MSLARLHTEPFSAPLSCYRDRTGSFASRMDLPTSWAGLRDEGLAAVTGVPDSVFCHLNLFIAGARSFEGAVRLAELALNGPKG